MIDYSFYPKKLEHEIIVPIPPTIEIIDEETGLPLIIIDYENSNRIPDRQFLDYMGSE